MLAYFDCFSGVAGDMIVGSLLAAGAPFLSLQDCVNSLGLDVAIRSETKIVHGISSTQFIVVPGQVQPIRHLSDILTVINNASAPDNIKQAAQKVFERLAQAEAEVHGMAIEQIHFHEIGAVDTIIDILGSLMCLYELGVTEVYSSPLPWNTGYVNISHGKYPLPAPATALLLKGIPVTGSACNMELVTPTGAAILASTCMSFGTFPASVPRVMGYGAGTLMRTDGVPNLIRVILAEESSYQLPSIERVGVIETEIDDMNPELFTNLFDLAQNDAGILDLFTTAVNMKKNRPGILITMVVCPHDLERVASMLLFHTTSLGVRTRIDKRYCLERTQSSINTPWGVVRVKVAQLPSGEVRAKPEYADCQFISSTHNLSLLEVYTVINRLVGNMNLT